MSLFTGEQEDGIMSNGNEAEPWIEKLIQNYGTRQRTARVLTRVLRVLESHAVGEATGSLKELDEDPVALLLLSDGPAAIHGLLTREAWQKFLRRLKIYKTTVHKNNVKRGDTGKDLKLTRGPHSLGAGEMFSSLAGHSVFLLRYNLMAHREVEEGKWQLMLTVHELTTTFTPEVHKPRRSPQEGPSSDSEPCCSESPVTACQERLSSLLLEVRGLLSPPCGPDCQGCPLTARTRWDSDRIRHKDGATFSIPVSCCYISERQMEVMQRQAASLCVSGTCSSGEQGERGYPHSPDPENDSLLEFGNQEKVLINPWDRFAAEVGIRTPSEEGSGSVSPEGLPEIDDAPLCSRQSHHSQPDVVAMATGRQMSTWSNRPAPCEKQANEGLESVGGSEQLRGPSNQSSHPPAEPASSSTASPSPVWTPLLANDVTLSLGLGPCRSNHWDHLKRHPRIRPPLPTPPICELKTQQEEGVLLSKSVHRSQRRKRPLLTVDEHIGFREDEEDQEEGGLHEEEEPTIPIGWDSCPSGPGTVRSLIKPCPKHAHPPATQDSRRRLSYTYDQKGCVAQAPRHLRVRDDILRWTVRYLIHKVPYESTS